MSIIEDISLLKSKTVKTEPNSTVFEFGPIFPGYGITLGHALRRVLLSCLKGSAITSVKIDGATHEFTSIKGVKEDITDLILNLKHITVKSFSEEPVILKLNKKGPGIVKAKDFAKNSQIEILDPEYTIATLDKDGKLSMEVTVERGYGYVPVEKRVEQEKMPLGTIAIDAIFNPIKKINYEVKNTRVGGETDYDDLIINITTNGTISPEESLKTGVDILTKYLSILTPEVATVKTKKTKVAKVRKSVKKIKKA